MAGTVKVGVDKNSLRLQFPSAVSQKIWGVRQKYKSLGLSDTLENRLIADRLANDAQLDIAFDRLDPTLKKYSAFALEESSRKAKQIQPKIPELLNLYTQYIEVVIKPRVRKSTFITTYSGQCLRLIKVCPDANIITDSVKIFEAIKQKTTPYLTRKMLDILYNLLEWCKRKKIVEVNALNPYKAYKKDVPGRGKQKKPKHIIELGLDEDDDFRGYSPQEAEHIIQAFSQRGRTPDLYKNLATFMFLTGCRPSEATGLRWKDISNDFAAITFQQTFSCISKEIDKLKTARHGKEKRKFPCGMRLQKLLKEMHENQGNPQPESLVFRQKETGKPVSWVAFWRCWVGYNDSKSGKHCDGVVEALIKEEKVSVYLKPYASRHSFITWQLSKGMTPANVAKLVGNSPEIIYKHYVSAEKDPQLAFEL
jgi:integrase